MTDKVRYAVLHDFNERIDYRSALGLNMAEIARFDSDDSVSDGELEVKLIKETEEERLQRLAEAKMVHDLFEAQFPTPAKKGKKGKKGKK